MVASLSIITRLLSIFGNIAINKNASVKATIIS